ncbi:MAG TPA: ABC-2 family transporter protein [Chloroflexota bacterium]|nr:ABC-2 family transporter protein [Chloroflexota bacterium]
MATIELHRPRGPLAELGKYGAVFSTTVRTQLAYAGEMALRTSFLVIILYVFLQLWQATFAAQGATAIAGFGVAQMVWYLALTEAIVMSRPRLSGILDEEVRSGEIAYRLVRPYAYAGYHLAAHAAERGLRFLVNLAVGTALALLYVGPVAPSWSGVPVALVVAALGALIDFLALFGIGLLAFWIEDTSSVQLIYSRLVMLLGGMLLPLEVFPEPVGSVARALPFSTMVYAPARLALAGGDAAWVLELLARQAVTLAVGGALVWLLYRAAARRVNVNGG